MSLLADATWTQLILIAIGSLFQFLALCEFVRERNGDRDHHEVPRKIANAQDEEQKRAEQAIVLRAIHAGPMTASHHDDEDEQPVYRAADLMKTAKVKFKQSFKFRDDPSS
jgi:hypothetical protein